MRDAAEAGQPVGARPVPEVHLAAPVTASSDHDGVLADAVTWLPIVQTSVGLLEPQVSSMERIAVMEVFG